MTLASAKLRREWDRALQARQTLWEFIPSEASILDLAAEFIEPDPWQQELLTSTRVRRMALCCRQSGKTTTAAILALWTAYTQPQSTTLIVASSERQSRILFSAVARMHRSLGTMVPFATSDRKTGLEISNGSRIEALPPTERQIRGFSPQLVIIDEAAGVLDEDFQAIVPMLAVTQGTLAVLGTPRARIGWFHKAWNGGDNWHRVSVTADECPRISAEVLQDAAKLMLPNAFRAEFYCEFTDAVNQVFPGEYTQAAQRSFRHGGTVDFGDDEW